ncbi:MAG: lipopolysaccharide transport periplasmic protein LptA [Oceanospirillales bacterium LUC14_002_19_P2]|nr:MAG: lipopolysaccharide transport periplasmic protein LptA [Oceanospirillales bacterium LUC14_002_19_P2]
MNHAKFTLTFIAAMTLFSATSALALPSDREKPIHISSDSADIDDKNGISIYRGNVIMTQGTTRLTGDIVTIYSQDRQIQKVVSEGKKKKAYFEEEQDSEKGLLKAWGKTIKYYLDNEKVELIKQARLEQKGDTFTGDMIEYDKQAQVVKAKADGANEGKRVEMVIQPRQ